MDISVRDTGVTKSQVKICLIAWDRILFSGKHDQPKIIRIIIRMSHVIDLKKL